MFLASRSGQSIRFDQADVRSMGRTAAGVYGMRFKDDDDFLVSAEVIPRDSDEETKILSITENGYGKRTNIEEHSVQGRGGMGVITIQTTDRNGDVVGCRVVGPNDELMLITDHGQIIRTRVSEISVYSRNTQGVRVMNTAEDERIVSIARIREEDLIEEEEEDLEEGEGEETEDAAETGEQTEEASDDGDAPIDDASGEEE
jgi:DNA gyrase subunit A